VLQTAASGWQSREAFLNSQAKIGAYPFSGNTSSVSASTKVSPGEKMHMGMVTNSQDFDILMKYLQTLGKTQILSNPKLAVINNQEARIHIGERQAYITSTITKGQTSDTVSEEVTFVDVGIQLSVTPTINDEGYVTMKVKTEVSSKIGELTTSLNNKIPIIDTSMAETTVMAKDGSTIIIGGLRKEEKTSSSEQVPILGKIPLLGFFFRSGTNKTERTELLVMLTPHIVGGDALITGNEREFGTVPGKEYKEYPSFTSQTDYQPPEGAPEEKMMPYKEYSTNEEGDAEPKPKIKGDRNE
jgi:type II secretory pathway component GspD/PulD (secretin)